MSLSGLPEHINVGPHHQMPEGFPFTADSPLRRLAEPAGIFLIPAIAGYTIMDDKVAAGVRAHSEFTERPIGRLVGTARSALKLVFGNEDEAFAEAERLHQFHATTVQGTEKDVSYSANDADLQAWVLACVFQGIEHTITRWTKRDNYDRDGLVRDIRTFGVFFGIQSSLLPADATELDQYWEERLTNGSLLQTEISRGMAQTVFRFSGSKIPKPIVRVGQAVWVTSLDPRLQQAANLVPNKADLRIGRAVDVMMRHTYALVPERRREQVIPAYLGTRRRAAAVAGKLSAAKA